MNKKKLAIICSTDYETWPVGGMLSFIRDILPYLKDYFEIDLWGVNPNLGCHKESISIGGKNYTVHYFSFIDPFRKKIIPNLVKVVFDLNRVKKHIMSKHYDILYFHGIPLELPFLNSNFEHPLIATHVHGITNPFSAEKGAIGSRFIQSFYEKVRKSVIRRSHICFLAADLPSYEIFISSFENQGKRIVKIHNFANPEIFCAKKKEDVRAKLEINPEVKIVISTGRFSRQKDPILAVTTFAKLTKIYEKNIIFFMVGDGPLLSICRSMGNKMALSKKIIFWGNQNREKVAELLNASDVYLYTSFGNGVPLSVVEALMCGLPIVTPNIPGIHDMVVNAETGYIVPNRAPEKLAAAVKQILDNKGSMSRKCVSKAKEFMPEKAAKEIAYSVNSL